MRQWAEPRRCLSENAVGSSGENDHERSRTAAAPRVELRLASAPGFDAFDLWRSSLEQLFETTLVGDRTAEFRGEVTGFHLGDALTFNSKSVGQRLERTRSRVRRSSIDHIMLQLQTSGRLTGDYEGQSVALRPGDISFVDFGRAARSVDTDFSRITLIIPRGQLPRTLLERDLHGVVLDCQSALNFDPLSASNRDPLEFVFGVVPVANRRAPRGAE